MKNPEHEGLLREILDDGSVADMRRQSLAKGLAYLQRRRRRNQLTRACAIVVLPVALALGAAFHLTAKHASAPPLMGLVSATPKVEVLTDEELFALFPHRAVALIGSPGNQELVFVDHGVASEQP